MNPLSFTIRALLCSLAFSAPAFAEDSSVRLKGTSVNLRGFDGQKLCVLPKSVKLTQLQPVVGSWMKVKVEGAGCPAEGYVASSLVESASVAKVERAPAIVPVPEEIAQLQPDENAGRAPAQDDAGDLAMLQPIESPSASAEPSPEPSSQPTAQPVALPKVDGATVELPKVGPIPSARPPQEQDNVRRKVTVTARGLNVRTADGEILCSVTRDTALTAIGRHGGGERLKVEISAPGCPKIGYVAESFVRPEATGSKSPESIVDSDGLSLRARPDLSQDSWKCALPKNFRVKVISDSSTFKDDVSFVKVKLLGAKKGCPEEGYVAEPYLRSPDRFADLPVIRGTEDCESGNCGGLKAGPKTGDAVGDIAGLGSGIGSALGDEKSGGPFVEGLRAMIKNKKKKPAGLRTSRGLVQIPLRGNRGPCGSFFYNASPHHIKNENRVFANPLSACVLTSVMQDWKKKVCPSRDAGCRFSFGDISHPTDPSFMRKHSTHTDGYCVDIRPPRKGDFSNSGMSYKWGGYDRNMMRKLTSLVKKAGGSNIYFNDPVIRKEYKGIKRAGGHDNHIHVCFKDNATTRATCDNLKVDPEVCPELQ